MEMIICVDIGNTTTTLGIVDRTSVKHAWRVMTEDRTEDEYGVIVDSLLARDRVDRGSIGTAGLCSVVPSETGNVVKALSVILGIDVVVVDGNTDFGMDVATDNPAEVGGDRIANAIGVLCEYGGPAIVVDVGTATTFDYVSARGEYRGGVIAPGLVAGARDLWKRARMLPAVEIRRPSAVIGTNTIACMQGGIYYGCISQIEGIVKRMWRELGSECRVIVTGGRAELVWEDLDLEVQYDPHLTLKGLAHAVEGDLRHRAGPS
jgi:type III pantothenate kinase